MTQTQAQTPNRAMCSQPTRVVLTRPADRQAELAEQLRQSGCEVLELSALQTTPLKRPAGEPAATIDAPSAYDAVVWVSRSAWQYDWDRPIYEASAQGDGRALPAVLAAVGRASASAIATSLGRPLDAITYPRAPAQSDSEGLWQQLQDMLAPAASVLIVRGQRGRAWLADTMRQQGLKVSTRAVYERCALAWTPAQLKSLQQWCAGGPIKDSGTWLITSADSLAAVRAQFDAHGLTGQPGYAPGAVVVVHPRLVKPVAQWLAGWPGLAPDIRVVPPQTEALLEALGAGASSA